MWCAMWQTRLRWHALLGGLAAREGRLDALVCNAGINVRKPIAQLALAEWSRVIGTNLTSTFLLVRAGEALLRAAKGAVVTIASTRAHMSEADTEAYAASKGGLVALTHALSISLAPDVRVNCISPGWIFTKGEPPRSGGRTPSIPPVASARRRTSPLWWRSWWGRRAASSPAPSSSSMAA